MPRRKRGWATIEDVIISHDEFLFMLINPRTDSDCYQTVGWFGAMHPYPLLPVAFLTIYGHLKTL